MLLFGYYSKKRDGWNSRALLRESWCCSAPLSLWGFPSQHNKTGSKLKCLLALKDVMIWKCCLSLITLNYSLCVCLKCLTKHKSSLLDGLPFSHQNPSIQNENLFQNWSALWALVEQSGFWRPCFSHTKFVVFYVKPQSFYQMAHATAVLGSCFSMASGKWKVVQFLDLLESSIPSRGTADWNADPTRRGFSFQSVCPFKLLPRGQLLTKLSHGLTLDCVSREDVLGPGWSTHSRAGHIYRDTEKGMATFAMNSLGEQRAAAGTWWCWQTIFNSLSVGWGWVWELAPAPARAEPFSWLWSLPPPGLCSVMWLHSFAEAALAFCEQTSQISVKFLHFLIKPRSFMLCLPEPKSVGGLLCPVSFRLLGAGQSIRLCSGNNWELGVGKGLQFLLVH